MFKPNNSGYDILYYSCRLSIYKEAFKNVSNSDKVDASPSDMESSNNDPTVEIKLKYNDEIPDVERIELPIQRTFANHKYCYLCFSKRNLTTIPEESRTQSYIKKKIYITQGNRCCRAHTIKNRIFETELGLLKVYSNTSSITALELSKIMETLSIRCDSNLFHKVGEYSSSEKQLEAFTRLNWGQLNDLKEKLLSQPVHAHGRHECLPKNMNGNSINGEFLSIALNRYGNKRREVIKHILLLIFIDNMTQYNISDTRKTVPLEKNHLKNCLRKR